MPAHTIVHPETPRVAVGTRCRLAPERASLLSFRAYAALASGRTRVKSGYRSTASVTIGLTRLVYIVTLAADITLEESADVSNLLMLRSALCGPAEADTKLLLRRLSRSSSSPTPGKWRLAAGQRCRQIPAALSYRTGRSEAGQQIRKSPAIPNRTAGH